MDQIDAHTPTYQYRSIVIKSRVHDDIIAGTSYVIANVYQMTSFGLLWMISLYIAPLGPSIDATRSATANEMRKTSDLFRRLFLPEM